MKKIFSFLIIPLLLGLGIVFSFFREIIIAYYYGTTRELEIFRVAYTIPYTLFQNLGAVLVGTLLPILIHEGEELLYQIKKQIQFIFIGITVFFLFTVSWQAKILAPGFNPNEISTLEVNLFICWFLLLTSALIFPIRLWLQEQDKKLLVSSTSLIYAFSFSLMIVILNKFTLKYNLAISALISSVILFLVYFISAKKSIMQTSIQNTNLQLKKKIQKIIIGSFAYVLLLTTPNVIDKAFASKMSNGVIAYLDYAMNFYIAIGVLIGTAFIITYARKIASEYKNSIHAIWLLKIVGLPFALAVLTSLFVLPFTNELIHIAYFRGAFQESDILPVGQILYWLLISLPFMVAGMILMQILAAYNVFVLIGFAILKVIVKLSWMVIFFNPHNLAIFGISNLVMELIAIITIIYFLKYHSAQIQLTKVTK